MHQHVQGRLFWNVHDSLLPAAVLFAELHSTVIGVVVLPVHCVGLYISKPDS